jgi:phosphoribosylamine--glycine ligase
VNPWSVAAPNLADRSSRAGSILVVDASGRGHAICDLFTRTNPTVTVYYGPGCDVIDAERIVSVPSISLTDVRTVLDFLIATPVEFIFVSHVDALVGGYVDVLRDAGHRVIGPSATAAALEASKTRGKRFCADHGIPVPEHRMFTDPEAAKAHIRAVPYACVVKVDGLTPNGDGAVVCDSVAEAEAAVDRFAEADGGSPQLVVEERVTGPEVSVFALLDGDTALLFPPALDYKRALEGDAGKNCDGMGSIAPHPADSPALRRHLRETLVEPLVRGLRTDGLQFSGFVYLGAILSPRGPLVLEINVRFGDSEAEAVLPGLCSDFLAVCRALLAGRLADKELHVDGLVRCSVALVQGCLDPSDPEALPGWPFGDFSAGQPVSGLKAVDRRDAVLFHANVRQGEYGEPVTSGGRVLHVVGAGRTLAEARARAYRQVARVDFPGRSYRSDIGVLPAEPARSPGARRPEAGTALEPALGGAFVGGEGRS